MPEAAPHPMINPAGVMITADAPMIRAMEILDRQSARIALVTDAAGKLIGSVVDGDIRRGFLHGHSLQTPVREVMHRTPCTLPVTASRRQILETMRMLDIKQIPLLNADGSIAGLVVHDILAGLKRPERPNRVVIMAGGKGRRLMPITSDIPKPMVSVGGKPILEWILTRCVHYGLTRVTLAVNYLGHRIEDYFGDGSAFGCSITYVKEKEYLGTAGALSLLDRDQLHPLLVMNGDILCALDYAELLDFHAAGGYAATLCARNHAVEIPYGVIQTENKCLKSITEKPVYDSLISAGIYVISPAVLPEVKPGSVMDMPALLLSLVRQCRKVGVFHMQEEWVDVGRHDDLERAQRSFSSAAS